MAEEKVKTRYHFLTRNKETDKLGGFQVFETTETMEELTKKLEEIRTSSSCAYYYILVTDPVMVELIELKEKYYNERKHRANEIVSALTNIQDSIEGYIEELKEIIE